MDLHETNPKDSHWLFWFSTPFNSAKSGDFFLFFFVFRKGCVFKIKILSSTFFNNLILGHHLPKREGR